MTTSLLHYFRFMGRAQRAFTVYLDEPGPDYSLTEVDTGSEWRDGRPIFRKVLGPFTMPGAMGSVNIPHGLGVVTPIRLDGIVSSQTFPGNWAPLTNGDFDSTSIGFNSMNVIVASSSDLSFHDRSYVYVDYVEGQPI